MKVTVPVCLITHDVRNKSHTATDNEGNRVLFAFSSLGKGREFLGSRPFCQEIAEQGESGGWFPYNMTGADDLRPFLAWRPESFLVVLDAKGLTDTSYKMVKLADLVEAIEQGKKEIEYVDYQPRKLHAEKT